MEEITPISKGKVREEVNEEYDSYIYYLKETTGRSEESLVKDDINTRIIINIVLIIIYDPLSDWVWGNLFLNGKGHPIERMLDIMSDCIFSERKLNEKIFEGHFDRSNVV